MYIAVKLYNLDYVHVLLLGSSTGSDAVRQERRLFGPLGDFGCHGGFRVERKHHACWSEKSEHMALMLWDDMCLCVLSVSQVFAESEGIL